MTITTGMPAVRRLLAAAVAAALLLVASTARGTAASKPTEPTNLRIVAATPTSVKLAWDHPGGKTIVYLLQYGVGGGGWQTVATVPDPDLAAQTTTSELTGLDGNTNYRWRVKAVDTATSLESGWSNVLTQNKLSQYNDGIAPDAPGGVQVSALSSTALKVSWKPSSATDVVGYQVYAGTSSGSLSRVATVGADQTTFQHPGLTPATTYYYQVRAVDKFGLTSDLVPKPPATGTTLAVAPSAPTGLKVVAVGDGTVALDWDDAPAGKTVGSWRLERATGSGSFQTVKSGLTSSQFTDTGLTNGTTYRYRVVAIGVDGTASAPSTEVTATPTALSLTLTATLSGKDATLQWTASSTSGISGYRLERGTAPGGPYSELASLSAGTTSYKDRNLAAGTYCYVVRAVSATRILSSPSNEACVVVTPAGLAAPTGLQVTVVGSALVVSWQPVLGAVSYEVQRSTKSGAGYEPVGTTATASFTDSTVQPGITYYYVVVAIDADGKRSPQSAEVSGMVPLPAATESPSPTTLAPTASPSPTSTTDPGPGPGPGSDMPGNGSKPPPGLLKKLPEPEPLPPPLVDDGRTTTPAVRPRPKLRTQTPPPAERTPAPDPDQAPGAIIVATEPKRRQAPKNGPAPGRVELPLPPVLGPRRARYEQPRPEARLLLAQPPRPTQAATPRPGRLQGQPVLPPGTAADLALAQGDLTETLARSAEEVAENVSSVMRIFRLPLFLLVLMLLYLLLRDRIGRETPAAQAATGADDDDVEYLL